MSSQKFFALPFRVFAPLTLFVLPWLFVLTASVSSQTIDPWSAAVNGDVKTAIPQPDGKILILGRFTKVGTQSRTNIARLNPDGSLDTAFNASVGGLLISQPSLDCICLLTNGQMLIGGYFDTVNGQMHYNVARLNSDGSLDPRFDAGPAVRAGTVTAFVLREDGRVFMCGASALWLLNDDGSAEILFRPETGLIGVAAVQADGKIVIGGAFTSSARTNIARLEPDGSLDQTFLRQDVNGGGKIVRVLAIQPDGKILVGGNFFSINDCAHTNIARLNADGSLDTDFNTQAQFVNCWGVMTFTLQTDRNILVGHDSPTLNGYPCGYLGRLEPDGNLDPAFSTNLMKKAYGVYSCAEQQDGKILVGGDFGSLCDVTNGGFGRLVNTGPANDALFSDGQTIVWLRSGAGPEVWRTSFESSTNSVDWNYLGSGVRTFGGWQLRNTTVPTGAKVRARGFVTGGYFNSSSWFVESRNLQWLPRLIVDDGNCGFRAGQFGFNVQKAGLSNIIIQASSDLLNWVTVSTNRQNDASFYFADPFSESSPAKFYRAISNN